MNLTAIQRAEEETKPCNLYNELREKLPHEIRQKVPKGLPCQKQYVTAAGSSHTDSVPQTKDLHCLPALLFKNILPQETGHREAVVNVQIESQRIGLKTSHTRQIKIESLSLNMMLLSRISP